MKGSYKTYTKCRHIHVIYDMVYIGNLREHYVEAQNTGDLYECAEGIVPIQPPGTFF